MLPETVTSIYGDSLNQHVENMVRLTQQSGWMFSSSARSWLPSALGDVESAVDLLKVVG